MLIPLRDNLVFQGLCYVVLMVIGLAASIWGGSLFLSDKDSLLLTEAFAFRFEDVYGGHLVDVSVRGITAMFLHGSLWHLVSNIWMLWIFGRSMEQTFGRLAFVLLVTCSSVIGLTLEAVLADVSGGSAIGASAGVSGVMGAYMVLYPLARIEAIFFAVIVFARIFVPAWALIAFWVIASDVLGVLGPDDGIAHWGHIGGFVTGVLAATLLTRGTALVQFVAIVRGAVGGRRPIGGRVPWRRPPTKGDGWDDD